MVSSKTRRTHAALFATPTPPDIAWRDVEALLVALGATLKEGSGSRIRVELNGVRMVFHKPHPRPVLVRDAVRSIRRFLTEAGALP
jgi:hypothetical protein